MTDVLPDLLEKTGDGQLDIQPLLHTPLQLMLVLALAKLLLAVT